MTMPLDVAGPHVNRKQMVSVFLKAFGLSYASAGALNLEFAHRFADACVENGLLVGSWWAFVKEERAQGAWAKWCRPDNALVRFLEWCRKNNLLLDSDEPDPADLPWSTRSQGPIIDLDASGMQYRERPDEAD